MKSLVNYISFAVHSLAISLAVSHAHAEVTVKHDANNLVITATTDEFGSAPAIVLHDDFDSGTIGQQLSGWSLGSSSGQHNPVYSNDWAVTGSLSGMANFTSGNYNSTAEYKNLPDMDRVYLSYYVKVDKLGTDLSRNIKLARLSGGYVGGTYVQAVGFTFYDIHASGQFLQATIDFSESKFKHPWTADYVDNQWHRIEQYIKLSNPAKTANGITTVMVDGKTITDQVNIVNEETGMRYKWLTLPYYVAHDPGGDYKLYYDNVVVSKNRARVELCENDTYSDCKQPIIVKAASWSPKSITIAKESFSPKKPYIFNFN